MADVFAGLCVGFTEVGIGYPFRTATTRIMNSMRWFGLPVRAYYRGAAWPLGSAVAFNGIAFGTKERVAAQTGSAVLGGAAAGMAVAPVLFAFDTGMFRRQIGQPTSWDMFRGTKGALGMTAAREAAALSVYFGTYDRFRKNGWGTFAAGGAAGLANWSATYWMETLRCRMICQRIGVRAAWRQGMLYAGFPIAAVRSVLVNSVSFSVFEFVHTHCLVPE